jgi:hypothetical protein
MIDLAAAQRIVGEIDEHGSQGISADQFAFFTQDVPKLIAVTKAAARVAAEMQDQGHHGGMAEASPPCSWCVLVDAVARVTP